MARYVSSRPVSRTELKPLGSGVVPAVVAHPDATRSRTGRAHLIIVVLL
jgi:hypothetical protein